MSVTAPETSFTSEPRTLEVVSFMAGGYRFAVEAAQVRTQLAVGQSATLPTAEQLLGLSAKETQASRRILLMKHPAGDYAVMVSVPVEMLSLEINAIHPLPPLIAARSTLVGLRGLAMGPEGVTVLVDFQAVKLPLKQVAT